MPLKPSRVDGSRLGILLRLTALAVVFGTCRGQDEDAFEVHVMLRSALRSRTNEESQIGAISETCISPEVAAAWRSSFQAAVDLMLQKTKRTMQQGLGTVAKGMQDLIEGSKACGQIKSLEQMKGEADRLQVLASTRSLAGLDSKVKYEPLKALTVGGIDVHLELNRLITVFQLKKGPEEVGTAMSELLKDFSEDSDDQPASAEPAAAPAPPAAAALPPDAVQRSSDFWETVLNHALHRFSDDSTSITAACISADEANRKADKFESAFRRMMEKNRRSMQSGLREFASSLLSLLDHVEASTACGAQFKTSAGAKRMRSAASRFLTLVGTRSLVNFGVHLEYEALSALRIGGIDVHKELNRLIGAWINNQGSGFVGDFLVDFLDDFREQEEEVEVAAAPQPSEEQAIIEMLKDAMIEAQDGSTRFVDLTPSCFPGGGAAQFGKEADAAIEHMLQKRKKTMQQGLKELADALDKLLQSATGDCSSSTGARAMWLAAKKLKTLTRKTVVDYGTYIKYEAMKSLEVGGVAIHLQLNRFLQAWKTRGKAEAGEAFGELFVKLSTIQGHDEL
eukprot:TRINITY_DN27226_c0_g1_i1.p1 TRINITY_DN27226_c0_g1~~TRINITY_DN27226_c0_g1_i1.p1  ORF type:complete len:566 (-),score=117.89 TRINITY_DN27226_c0_g1_i1:393-2090(-)